MKESIRLAQEAQKKAVEKRLAEDQYLLTKPAGQLTGYDIDRMTGDIYKQRLLTDPKFVEVVNKK
jgi:hypothetical protein